MEITMFLITLPIFIAAVAAEAPSRAYLPQNSGSQGFTGSTQSQGFIASSSQNQRFSGSSNQNQGYSGTTSSFSSSASGFGVSSNGFGASNFNVEARNTRPQQEIERNAEILRQSKDADENGNFQYAYETSNGIRAAETGNAASSQGEFSYQGDDGNTYTVVFRAGEAGFEAQGAHLPVAPPTPEAILVALEKNAKDEASGIFDDGKYRPTGDDGQYRADQEQSYLNRGQGNIRAGQFGQATQSGQFGQATQSGQNRQTGFGSANHQGTFSQDNGYQY